MARRSTSITEVELRKIGQTIKIEGWFHFGKEEFDCPGLEQKDLESYMESRKLPSPCDRCYKALIFWDKSYFKENLTNFFNLIGSFGVHYRGKLNESVVVFYFRDKAKMLEFLQYLEKKLQEYSVKGRTQWRRACKEYQNLRPELWRNAKEFIPDSKS